MTLPIIRPPVARGAHIDPVGEPPDAVLVHVDEVIFSSENTRPSVACLLPPHAGLGAVAVLLLSGFPDVHVAEPDSVL